jgi:hypothetical protein
MNLSKTYNVDTWFPPFEDLPPQGRAKARPIESRLVCSDDGNRAYVREEFGWMIFKIDSTSKKGGGLVDLDCVYVDTVGTQKEAYEYLEGRVSKHPPGPAQHYCATNCKPDAF